ncbi:unnamed protein product [Phytophthora fragariaefolia]|uniref:Unnamed protein product n=1 Tax=Phytophthora fragariaefolia TaxID=1490495 RepID=A0A9W6YN25_9STRA|nr:unnamed protein product [Phytophthora fragariaefolia]
MAYADDQCENKSVSDLRSNRLTAGIAYATHVSAVNRACLDGVPRASHRPSPQTFKIEPFNGFAQPGAIDSGIAACLRRSEALLGMQEDLHSAQLPDNIKNASFFQHLSVVASQWYIASLYDNRSCSFESLGRALKKEFGSKLSKAQIGQMVAAERKNTTKTYREYSIRLRTMTAATTFDGFKNCNSNNLARSSFIANARLKHADNLRMAIRQDSNHPGK